MIAKGFAMYIQDAAAFAAGLAIEEPMCPLPIVKAIRLFWVADPIVVPETLIGEAAAPAAPVTAAFDLATMLISGTVQ